MIEENCKLEEGKRLVGLKQVTKAIINDKIKTVYIATDCDKFIENKIQSVITEGVSVKKQYSQTQLGKACNIDVAAAVVGILAE